MTKWLIVGLGNPGGEYAGTRHNAGHLAVGWLQKKVEFKKAELVALDSLMNNSGPALIKAKKLKADRSKLIVIHDDLDLPLGSFKLSFGRGAGGHRGVESIIRALKTKDFWRLRLGIVNKKKPKGEAAVVKFILGKFKPAELKLLQKGLKDALPDLTILLEL